MSSLKQIEANRRNALMSTGPITPDGKDRSRRNAVRHGLTAETVITTLEDAEDYQAFEAAVIADYDAETAVERELVLRLASVLWRLRRAIGIETALFDLALAELGKPETSSPRLTLVRGANLPEQNQLSLIPTRQSEDAPASDPNLNPNKDVGNCYLHLAAQPTFALDRLSRYEHLLWRQARQIVITLESHYHRRQSSKRARFPFAFRQSRS
jgi:hypothetical protein